MKTIVVKWVPEDTYGYGKAMRVIESDHKRFVTGSRFDFGFMSIATDEGYTIVSLPMGIPEDGTKLFTFPPIHDIEAIENRVAEACAKVYLETYDLTDIADDVRSGEWRKYK